MATRYAFNTKLKELRFLFCQTGEDSSNLRCAFLPSNCYTANYRYLPTHTNTLGHTHHFALCPFPPPQIAEE